MRFVDALDIEVAAADVEQKMFGRGKRGRGLMPKGWKGGKNCANG